MVTVSPVIKSIILRLVLPFALGTASLIRPSLISLAYGVCALLSPAFPAITNAGAPGSTKTYLVVTFVISLLGAIAQAAFQLTAAFGGFSGLSPTCSNGTAGAALSSTGDFLFQVGLQAVGADVGQGVRLLLPDLLALAASVAGLILCLGAGTAEEELFPDFSELTEDAPPSPPSDGGSWGDRMASSLLKTTDVLAVATLCGMGTVAPSVLCLVYFLTFLGLLTWWAAYSPPITRPQLNRVKAMVLVYTGLHLVLLYLYQLPAFGAWLSPDTLVARLGGLWQVAHFDCGPSGSWWMSLGVRSSGAWEWQQNAGPIVLLAGFFLLAYQLRLTLNGTDAAGRGGPVDTRDDNSSLHEELYGSQLPQSNGGLLQPSSDELDRSGEGGKAALNPSCSRPLELLCTFVAFLVNQSYALSLLAMIAWAVVYHSGFSFIWLIFSCALWSFPNTSNATYTLSPLIVAYAHILLVLQYIYSLDFKESEIPLHENTFATDMGFNQIPNVATCIPLWIKAVFSLPFFLTMRMQLERRNLAGLSAAERRRRLGYGTFAAAIANTEVQSNQSVAGSMDAGSTTSLVEARGWLESLMGKYFIFVVGIVLLVVAIRPPFALYSLGYLVAFLTLITLLQLSFAAFRRVVFVFLTIVLVYSGLVLIWIYAFQFSSVCTAFGKAFGNNTALLKDLGVDDCADATQRSIDWHVLLRKLLTPLSVLFVVVMQCKFFHGAWLAVTDPLTDQFAGQGLGGDGWLGRLGRAWTRLTETAWRAAEIHWWKLVCFSFAMLCAYEVNAMNVVLMALLCLIIPGRIAQMLLFLLSSTWLSVVVFVKEAFQLQIVKGHEIDQVFPCPHTEYWNVTAIADWAGFVKLPRDAGTSGWPIGRYLAGSLLALLCLAVEGIVRARQSYWRAVRGQDTPARPLLFPGAVHAKSNDSLRSMIGFLANFFFYKFGVEVCFVTTMIVAAVRLDVMAVIYAVLLLGLFCLPRRSLRLVWWPYVFLLTLVFGAQYLVCVRIPCVFYPWPIAEFGQSAVRWFYLPTNVLEQNSKFLIADFFQLLFAACQAVVFGMEGLHTFDGIVWGDVVLEGDARGDEDGGSNEEIWRRQDALELGETNPYADFMTDAHCILDVTKQCFFAFFQWITLIMLFIAGLGAISVFALIYLIAAFLFLWKGNDLYLKPLPWVVRKWRAFTILNIAVVLSKLALQLVGCVYMTPLLGGSSSGSSKNCWLVQLFSIVCVHPDMDNVTVQANSCGLSRNEADVTYDVLCFAALLVQLRILGSYYFRHVVDELRAERILSSRGAVLINQLVAKEMKTEIAGERGRVREITVKAQRIREAAAAEAERRKEMSPDDPRYMLDLGTAYEIKSYAQGGKDKMYYEDPLTDPDIIMMHEEFAHQWVLEMEEAKRAGDKYMFSGDPNEEATTPVESVVPEVMPGASEQQGMDPLERIHALVESDLDFDKVNKEDEKEASAQHVAPPFQDEPEEEEEKGTLAAIWEFLVKFAVSTLDWMTAYFNRRSRDHRYVAFVLDEEKQKLKSQINQSMESSRMNGVEVTRKSIREFREELLEGEAGDTILYNLKSDTDVEALAKKAENYWASGNALSRWVIALGMVLVSHTELICYMMMFMNHAFTAAILSLPLPLLALFWGTLSSPRPAKFFWIVVIAYTEGLVVVKFLFQFQFFKWGGAEDNPNPFWPPRILGIQREAQFAAWDVALLICLFFHRYMMRKLGLWKDAQYVVAEDASRNQSEVRLEVQENGTAVEAEGVKSNSMELQELADGKAKETPKEEAPDKKGPGAVAYLGSCGAFYQRLLNPTIKYIRDMYPLLFLADLLCFLICAFGYSSFGLSAGSGDVLSDVQSNRVPLPWVLMLLTLLVLIIIDRGLYLRKATTLKLVFQYLLVIGVHIYIFFVLPSFSDRSVQVNRVAQAFYIIKCIYFLFSAWQIRNGYPSQVVGNLLTKSADIPSFGLFSIFFTVPFLFEIRTLIDWIWTDTSMPLFDFFTMENFYAIIFKLKCGRYIERKFPAPRGEPKGVVVKYAMGGGMLLAIIIIIFLPLLLYSLLNYIGEQFLPQTVTFTVTISGYPALYSMIAQRDFVQPPSQERYDEMYGIFKTTRNKRALEFLSGYSITDTQFVVLRYDSLLVWDISDPSYNALKVDLAKCASQTTQQDEMYLMMDWKLSRRPQPGKSPVEHIGSHSIKMVDKICQKFYDVLNGSVAANQSYIKIYNAYPPYIILPSEGETQDASGLLNFWKDPDQPNEKNINSTYSSFKLNMINSDRGSRYWTNQAFKKNKCDLTKAQVCGWNSSAHPSTTMNPDCCTLDADDPSNFMMVVFADKLFPAFLSAVVKGGIIAMYVAVVILLSGFIRRLVVGNPLDVIVSEMPNVDRLYKMCQDLYLVREAKDFAMEQDIFAKLIFLFRSPDTLVKWTRPKPLKEKEE